MNIIDYITSAATLVLGTAIIALPVLGFQENLARGMDADAAIVNCLAPFLSAIGL